MAIHHHHLVSKNLIKLHSSRNVNYKKGAKNRRVLSQDNPALYYTDSLLPVKALPLTQSHCMQLTFSI